jgi:DNA-binding CsgD family transcriptional regulator
MTLIGRTSELEAVRGHLIGRLQPPVLQIIGEPGIGKSALLQATMDIAAELGVAVFCARGSEFGRHIAFDAVTAIQHALRGSAGGDAPMESSSATPLLVHMQLLAQVRQVAKAGPIAIFVDDVHWLDGESAKAFRFLALHLAGEAIAMVFTARPDEVTPVSGLPCVEVSLGPIGESHVSDLLGAPTLPRALARQLHVATGGNVLSIVELRQSLTPQQLSGRSTLPDPIPIGKRTTAYVATKLDLLSSSSRLALCVAAADDSGDIRLIEASLSLLGLSWQDLERAEESQLFEVSPGRFSWKHPLYRSACYHGQPAAERRRAHKALATAWETDGLNDPLRAAWHAAHASAGPDDMLAMRLGRIAEELGASAALITAAELFEFAGRLMTRDSDRVTAFQKSGQAFLRAGSLEHASRILSEALALARSDLGRQTPIVALLGETEAWRSGPGAACTLLLAHAHRLEITAKGRGTNGYPSGTSPNDRALVLCIAALSMLIAGDVGRIADIGREAMAIDDEDVDETIRTLREVVFGCGLLQCGDAQGASVVAGARARAEALVASSPRELDVLSYFLALTDTTGEDFESAERSMRRLISLGVEHGFETQMAVVLLAEVLWRTGRWGESRTILETQQRLIDPAERGAIAGVTAAMLAKLRATTGDLDRAVALGRDALEFGTRLGCGVVTSWARHALGLAAIARGDFEVAVIQLRALSNDARSWRSENPGSVWWAGDLIESLIECGRIEEAVDELDSLERQASTVAGIWPIAVAKRYRGQILGGLGGAVLAKESARDFERLGAPFERARSLLAAGAVGEALDIFGLLGARSWAEIARSRIVRVSSGIDGFTASELRVAIEAARGGGTKALAQTLNLSPKTVEFHLGRIYRKLGVSSRAEFVAKWRTSNDPQPSASRNESSGQKN